MKNGIFLPMASAMCPAKKFPKSWHPTCIVRIVAGIQALSQTNSHWRETHFRKPCATLQKHNKLKYGRLRSTGPWKCTVYRCAERVPAFYDICMYALTPFLCLFRSAWYDGRLAGKGVRAGCFTASLFVRLLHFSWYKETRSVIHLSLIHRFLFQQFEINETRFFHRTC